MTCHCLDPVTKGAPTGQSENAEIDREAVSAGDKIGEAERTAFVEDEYERIFPGFGA